MTTFLLRSMCGVVESLSPTRWLKRKKDRLFDELDAGQERRFKAQAPGSSVWLENGTAGQI